MEAHTQEDTTRVYTSHDREWIPIPLVPKGEGHIKVINVDEERGVVVFKFKFSEGCELPRHTHKCHAIAYTISGEWEYEGLKLLAGATAYEPVDSTHTPASGPGAEAFVVLTSTTDQFLIEHLPDGTDGVVDIERFKQLEALTTPEQVQAFVAAMAEGNN